MHEPHVRTRREAELGLSHRKCATGYASVFTIGGLYVACFERYLGKGVSLGSYLQADSIGEPRA